ncbi:hypothetical protein HDE_03936 [Halotydeus destructor]|nr:hypothetical protein HDE_03936 [Halotydeus destructor]
MQLKQFLSNSYLNFGGKLPSKSTTFIFVKWLLFSFVCFILLASAILVFFTSRLIADLEPHATPEQLAHYKLELVVGLGAILIFFTIGAYGILKEHFCMSTAFAIFMMFLLIGSVADNFHGIVFISIFTILSVIFTSMVRKNNMPLTTELSAA